ncbi:MAG: hypothetical protein LUE97_02040 [Oscillospiraceae bacterium]|nr:hypothetical protein [Oscillospiraceae bacterium]
MAESTAALYAGTSKEKYINELYDARRAAAEKELRAAYDENMSALDTLRRSSAAQYDASRRQTAADAAVTNAAANEAIAANGLNTGAGSQVRLAQSTALLGSLGALSQEKSAALADIDSQRSALTSSYRTAVAQAIADNDLARAQALYDEAMRLDSELIAASLQSAKLNAV